MTSYDALKGFTGLKGRIKRRTSGEIYQNEAQPSEMEAE